MYLPLDDDGSCITVLAIIFKAKPKCPRLLHLQSDSVEGSPLYFVHLHEWTKKSAFSILFEPVWGGCYTLLQSTVYTVLRPRGHGWCSGCETCLNSCSKTWNVNVLKWRERETETQLKGKYSVRYIRLGWNLRTKQRLSDFIQTSRRQYLCYPRLDIFLEVKKEGGSLIRKEIFRNIHLQTNKQKIKWFYTNFP